MEMIPPAIVNEQVTKDRFHWYMTQPRTITIDKDKVDQEFLDKLSMTTATLSDVVITPSEFVIDDKIKDFILFELQKILEFNGFESELLDSGSLQISKYCWKMDIENIRDQLPFSECFLYQIEQAYKHQYEYNLHSSQAVDIPCYEHLSRIHLESIRQNIVDNTDGDL